MASKKKKTRKASYGPVFDRSLAGKGSVSGSKLYTKSGRLKKKPGRKRGSGKRGKSAMVSNKTRYTSGIVITVRPVKRTK